MKQDLKDIEVYQNSIKLGNIIWEMALEWDEFARDTIGIELVRSVDSIAANIASGYGKQSHTENRRSCYTARGHLFRTAHFLKIAKDRNLIPSETEPQIRGIIEKLPANLSEYIKQFEEQAGKSK